MSFQIHLQNLSIEERKKILNDLIFEQKVGNNQPKIKKVQSFHLNQDTCTITLPFYYYKSVLVKEVIPKWDISREFPLFSGKLFDEQIQSRNECIQHLNENKSCILSLPVGCGKCLHPDTNVLMLNGSLKKVSEIKPSDVLIGPDGCPRIVKSTVTGIDKLYTIRNDTQDVKYTVNSEHILTLYNIETKSVEDVSLQSVFSNVHKYRGIRTSLVHLGGRTAKERYRFIESFFKGQKKYTTSIKSLVDKLVFIGRSLGFGMFSILNQNGDSWTITKSKKRQIASTYQFSIEYHSIGEYCGFELTGDGRFLLGDFTVTHNTATAINISTKIKLKTLVILNRLLLIEQWRDSILKFCPDARVYTIQPKIKVIPPDYHFYLINAINVSKINRTAFDFIGFCIVDECHMIMSEILSQCMWNISPKYLLGLSATPYRIDGLNDMISSYFGSHRITRDIQRKHIIYKVNTGLTIEFTYNRFGKMDWNSLLAFQSTCFARNQIIIDIVKQYPERYFLLLTKRIEQGKILSTLLEKENIEHDCLFGQNKYIETTKHVLIGTTGKCGVGFDAPKLNTLVLCNDMVNYYIQMLGRVMRQKDSDAWVFDLVDENPVLIKHYYERCKTYKKYGGTFEKTLPLITNIL